MLIAILIICIILFVLLVIVAGINPTRSSISNFELERRKANRDEVAAKTLHREMLLNDIQSLQRALTALLLVVLTMLLVAGWNWWGGMIAIIVALEYGAISRLALCRRFVQRLYERHEKPLLGYIEKLSGILFFIRTTTPTTRRNMHINSREELQHLIAHSGTLLTDDEKKLAIHGLQFNNRTVREIMIPRKNIASINKKELLGPLVLDDLHKTGHTHFPVIDGDIDHIIGVLHMKDMFTLGVKRSLTAASAMEVGVAYVREDHSLRRALAALLQAHRRLLIVIDETGATTGLISLEDVIKALFGHKIIDNFDAHENVQAVAMRKTEADQ